MAKRKLIEVIEKIGSKPILAALLVFSIFFIITVGFSMFKYGYNEEFFKNIVVEAHGMLFDILVIGVFIFALHKIGEKRLKRELEIERYHEEIDDFRLWESEDASFRIVGNIKRLNRYGITKVNINNCYLKKAQLIEVQLRGANLQGANLQEANFWKANLQGADLSLANLQKAHLRKVNFQSATLWTARLQGAKLIFAKLQGSDLRDADLQGAEIWKASLQNANLSNANLQQTNLWKTNLEKADLEDANLKEAKLMEANLHAANLENADLTEANFQGAILIEARGLHVEQLSKASTFYQSELDKDLLEEIREKYPQLLEKPEKKE